MSRIVEIEDAIQQLKPAERAQLAAWFARREAVDWDAQMQADSESGKLDFLFHEADEERESGRLKDWPAKK